ncbi:MAG TPA: hypothetical protein VJ997_14975, partial [Longimicrobiales bacterium]|nr:hypothetical protein [Longimicrobiales bacterium]
MPETSASITPSPVGPPENPEEPSQDPSPEQGGTPLPEGLGEGAEKFKTVEDLLKSYRELETKLSGGAPDPQPGGDPEPDQDPGPS